MKIELNKRTIIKKISEDSELIVRKRSHRYSAVVKDLKTGLMTFSKDYETIRNLNEFFLSYYGIEVVKPDC